MGADERQAVFVSMTLRDMQPPQLGEARKELASDS